MIFCSTLMRALALSGLCHLSFLQSSVLILPKFTPSQLIGFLIFLSLFSSQSLFRFVVFLMFRLNLHASRVRLQALLFYYLFPLILLQGGRIDGQIIGRPSLTHSARFLSFPFLEGLFAFFDKALKFLFWCSYSLPEFHLIFQ